MEVIKVKGNVWNISPENTSNSNSTSTSTNTNTNNSNNSNNSNKTSSTNNSVRNQIDRTPTTFLIAVSDDKYIPREPKPNKIYIKVPMQVIGILTYFKDNAKVRIANKDRDAYLIILENATVQTRTKEHNVEKLGLLIPKGVQYYVPIFLTSILKENVATKIVIDTVKNNDILTQDAKIFVVFQ